MQPRIPDSEIHCNNCRESQQAYGNMPCAYMIGGSLHSSQNMGKGAPITQFSSRSVY